jgi:ATP phosphoribosyltransferase regulatory subunit
MKLRSSITPIPPGASDLAGEAVRRRRVIQRRMLDALEATGFEEIIPPTFEYAEVFVRAAGPEIADRLIRFLDLDGKLLALRYDFTASVARIAATKLADRPTPLRLCYTGMVFRQDPERGQGRPREILQLGAELLGEAGVAADIEALRLTIELLRRADFRDFQLNVGHVGALTPALAALPDRERATVRRLIDRKDAAGLASAAPGLLAELPFLLGRGDILHRAAGVVREAGGGPEGERAIEHLAAIDSKLVEDERRHVVYDFGEVRGLDYYTGIHFEVFVAGAGAAVGAGGRYDDLMARFGRPLPAVGFALDVDGLAEARP